MVPTLTSRIHQIINQLEKYPYDSMDFDIAVPYQLLQRANAYFVSEALKVKDGKRIIKNEIESNRVSDVIRRTLARLIPMGITFSSNPALVEHSIQYILKYIIKNYPVHLAWSPVNVGVQYPTVDVEDLDEKIGLTSLDLASPWEELHYGVENSLFFWSGQRWRITQLGLFMKSLSIPTGTVFLLMLENYLNVPERKTPFNINPWHISKTFLGSLLNDGKTYIDVGEGRYGLSELDPNMSFLNRLDQFQLTNTVDLTEDHRSLPDQIDGIPLLRIADDFYETSLTDYGVEIVKRVLDESPNILRSMIENLVRFELSGQQYYDVTNEEGVRKLNELVGISHEIAGDQKEPINQITNALVNKRLDILTLRAIPPTIERILKNILIQIGEVDKSDSRITLGQIVKKFEERVSKGRGVIQFDTIQYIKNIDRNALLHGSISPDGEIKVSLINLMINVLIKVFEDYRQWNISSVK